jgi:translation initiation factor 2-alpha kinase 1
MSLVRISLTKISLVFLINLNLKILRETRVFSSLNHANIVNYHSSWLEFDMMPSKQISSSEFSTKNDESIETESNYYAKRNKKNNKYLSEIASETDWTETTNPEPIVNEPFDRKNLFTTTESVCGGNKRSLFKTESSTSSSSGTNPNVFFRKPKAQFTTHSSFSDLSEEKSKILDKSPNNKDLVLSKRITSLSESVLVLYIQMKLCDLTLRQWLDDRNSNIIQHKLNLDEHLCMNIFRQIISGVEYIHSKAIIHRDIKVKQKYKSNK